MTNAWRHASARTGYARSIAVDSPPDRYFSGKLLDAASFALEQSYFRCGHNAALATGLWLELDDGSGLEPWYEVRDFSSSKQNDRHFILDREAAVVRFGDGEYGRVPLVGADVRGWYRIGPGAAGNLPSSCMELVTRLAEVSRGRRRPSMTESGGRPRNPWYSPWY
jgi:hypothetical protein